MYTQLLNHAILPTLLPLTKSRYWSLARQVRQRQFWPQETMRSFQLERLTELVRHAAEHVPFYRERFQEVGFEADDICRVEDLQGLPITTKADIQANFPDRMIAEHQRDDDWQYVGTGGTTNRVMVVHDFAKRDFGRAGSQVALTDDSDYCLGKRQVSIPPDACSALCGIEGFRETSVLKHLTTMILRWQIKDPEAISNLRGLVMNNWIQRSKILEPFGPDGTHIGDKRLAEYVAAIRQRRPTLVTGLPEYLQMLARYVKRTGDTVPTIPVVRPLGANMSASVKKEVEEVLAGEVREHYGSQELGAIAFDCRCRQGLHVLADQFIVELIRNGSPVDDGEIGSVVLTDLTNTAMPLIRYQIGDVARLHRSPCPCGRNTPRITLEGRLEDTFVTQSGRVLTPEAVCEFFYNQPGIDQFQLFERLGKWELKYVPANGTVHQAELIRRFREFSGDDRMMKIRCVESILPESSGKFRHTKSISYEKFSTGKSPLVEATNQA
jgi:phenylacetate-CoA ligase